METNGAYSKLKQLAQYNITQLRNDNTVKAEVHKTAKQLRSDLTSKFDDISALMG